MSPSRRPPAAVAVVESVLGVALVLCGMALAIFTHHWTVAFWLATLGAAGAGHGLTWGLGLLERPFFWSARGGE